MAGAPELNRSLGPTSMWIISSMEGTLVDRAIREARHPRVSQESEVAYSTKSARPVASIGA